MYLLSLDRDKYSFIEADNSFFKYTGRVDFSDKKAPTIIYAGSMILFKFQGTSLKIAVKNHHCCYDNYIGYIIDGNVHGRVKLNKDNKVRVIDIMSGLSDKEHEVIIFKRQDACHYFDFLGVVLDKGCKILELEMKRPKRRIECFGGSLSCGELSELAVNIKNSKLEKLKAEFSNGCLSFPLVLGRYLGAEVYNNSQGGLALVNGTGFFGKEKTLGLEYTYDKLRYNPELGECTKWDFTRFTPHVVIIEMGQHDNYPFSDIGENKKSLWKEKYKEILTDLRRKYPKALF